MGLRGIPETELIFEDCWVPAENVVVMPDSDPLPNLEGFKKLMYGYNGQRTGASAVALGIAQGAHDLAMGYMKQRETFGTKLFQYQGLQWFAAETQCQFRHGVHPGVICYPADIPKPERSCKAGLSGP